MYKPRSRFMTMAAVALALCVTVQAHAADTDDGAVHAAAVTHEPTVVAAPAADVVKPAQAAMAVRAEAVAVDLRADARVLTRFVVHPVQPAADPAVALASSHASASASAHERLCRSAALTATALIVSTSTMNGTHAEQEAEGRNASLLELASA